MLTVSLCLCSVALIFPDHDSGRLPAGRPRPRRAHRQSGPPRGALRPLRSLQPHGRSVHTVHTALCSCLFCSAEPCPHLCAHAFWLSFFSFFSFHSLLGLGGGHYNAFCLNHTDGQWYLHDDSSVSRVRNLGDIKSSAAYVLCYRRRQRGAQVRTEEQMAADMAAFNATLPKSSSSWSSSSDLD